MAEEADGDNYHCKMLGLFTLPGCKQALETSAEQQFLQEMPAQYAYNEDVTRCCHRVVGERVLLWW